MFNVSIILLIMATVIQLLYFLILIKGFLNYSESSRDLQPVSVVVAARNEMKNLPSLLEQLSNQSHTEYEIVIVNDRSTDGTFDFLSEQDKVNDNLKVVTVAHKPEQMDGKKYALTLGIKAAQYQTILLTDADCEMVDEDWLAAMSSNFSQDSVQMNLGVSLHKKSHGLLGTFIQFESLWTSIQYVGFALVGMPYMGVGRNLGYRKDLFLSSKGFNSIMNITGGDDDLFVNKHANRSNTSVQLGASSLTFTSPKNTWREFFLQKLRHINVGSGYKFKHRLVLGLLVISQSLFWASLIYSVIFDPNIYILSGAFLIRTLFLYLTFIIASKKIGNAFHLWGLVFLDFIFVFYYLSTGVRAIFTKRVRWS